jgi:N-acetylglucosaminyldiphosphoundecaprenol N-acetyl-beta-D-mannosaminyltransferase
MKKNVPIFGISIDALDMASAVAEILRWLDTPKELCRYVVTPNVDHLVKLEHHEQFRRAYADASLVLCDSRPLWWVARLIGKPLPSVVTGSDLVPAIFDAIRDSASTTRVFLLGAAPGVGEQARSAINERWKSLNVVDTFSPPHGFENDSAMCSHILERIRAAAPDLLLVGLGAPKQELWVHAHRDQIAAKAALCIGATIDFLAGTKRRAPRWMQRHGLEWLHRVSMEPRRLGARYAYDALNFPRLIAREWYAMHGANIARTYLTADFASATLKKSASLMTRMAAGRGTRQLTTVARDSVISVGEAPITRFVQRIDVQLAERTRRSIHFIGLTRSAGVSTIASAYASASATLYRRRVLLISLDELGSNPETGEAIIYGRAYDHSESGESAVVSRSVLRLGSNEGSRGHPPITDPAFWHFLPGDFDEIIFEGAAPAHSPQALMVASHADAVLLVAEAEHTRADAARQVLLLLRSVRANVIGSVLNKQREYRFA